jgi:biopolymer transport protein ExbB
VKTFKWNPTTPTLGFAHLLAQSDAVGKTCWRTLVLMSVASWALIAIKSYAHWQRQRRSEAFLRCSGTPIRWTRCSTRSAPTARATPFRTSAPTPCTPRQHHARHGGARLADAGTASDFITRTIKKVLDEETMRLESGLTVLATVGATAPFVGLFGTVWGVYHALVAIGMSGAGTLDKVAGPVGEALIMTGIGLAVAIPGRDGLQRLCAQQPRAHGAAGRLCLRTAQLPDPGPAPGAAAQAPARRAGPAVRALKHGRLTGVARHGLRLSFDRQRGSAPMAEINMVPLIDVMLVLLVIFIVTAPLLTHAVKLELPRAEFATQPAAARQGRLRHRRRRPALTGTASR